MEGGNRLDVVRELVLTDFKLKYNCSVLGYFWSLLNPLMHFLVLLLVFSVFLGTDIPQYPLYLLLGIILWNFFAECSRTSLACLVNKSYLLRNMPLSKFTIIFSSSIISVLTVCLNLAVFFFFTLFFSVDYGFNIVFFVFNLVLLYLLAFSIGLVFSSLYVKFRDLEHIYNIVLSAGFWITPIAYSHDLVPSNFLGVYLLNPVARVLIHSRDVLIYNNLGLDGFHAVTFVFFLAVFFFSIAVFRVLNIDVGDYL